MSFGNLLKGANYDSTYSGLMTRYGRVLPKTLNPRTNLPVETPPSRSAMEATPPEHKVPEPKKVVAEESEVEVETPPKPKKKMPRKEVEKIQDRVKYDFAKANGVKSGEARRARNKKVNDDMENEVLDKIGELGLKEARKVLRKEKKTINILRKAMVKVEKSIKDLPDDEE